MNERISAEIEAEAQRQHEMWGDHIDINLLQVAIANVALGAVTRDELLSIAGLASIGIAAIDRQAEQAGGGDPC